MDDFLRFVVERHRIWEQRQAGLPQPWTDDPILQSRKFTNVFRVLDPGTQYLLTDVFDPDLDPRDTLMRCFLYRHTGRVEAWEYLALAHGLPTVATLADTRQGLKEYRGATTTYVAKTRWAKENTTLVKPERSVFTSAYSVSPLSQEPGTDKLDSVLNLVERLFTPGSPEDIMPDWLAATTQADRFKVLRRNKGVGDFMSMQILTDWGYQCGEDREEEFLMPGPGSRNGAKAIDPGAKTMDVVRRVVKAVREVDGSPRLGMRPPSLMDIGSNLLCEWSKYVRYSGKPMSAKVYRPAHPGKQPDPVLPDYYTEELI